MPEKSGMEATPRVTLRPAPPAVDVKSLHAKIGELTLENDFLGLDTILPTARARLENALASNTARVTLASRTEYIFMRYSNKAEHQRG